jgi:hypothetical protein
MNEKNKFFSNQGVSNPAKFRTFVSPKLRGDKKDQY